MDQFFASFSEIRLSVWLVIGAIFILSIIGIVILKKNKQTTPNSLQTKKIVYGGLCIALSFILSYIKLGHMPQGGSITLASMLPLVLFAFAFGPVAGIVAGISYGFLQLFQDLYIVHWAQLLLDYPLAFGLLGLAGIIPEKLPSLQLRFGLGILVAIIARGAMHTISGAIFFAEYAGEMNPWIYSIGYNLSYLSVEFVITLILGVIIASTPVYKIFKQAIHA